MNSNIGMALEDVCDPVGRAVFSDSGGIGGGPNGEKIRGSEG